ncbi:MAG: copper chaperone PCu(A)C [Methylocella sp.]
MSKLTRRSFAAFAAPFLASSLLIFTAPGAFAHEFKLGALEIVHPWSRATAGGAKVAIGYLVIKNAGAEPDRLVSATAEVAGSVDLHEMATVNGVATMRPVTGGIVIPAHGEVALKPGSYHLMLEDLKQPLKKGDSFKGTLTFEKAGTSDVIFLVESIGAKAPADEGHMDHMKAN